MPIHPLWIVLVLVIVLIIFGPGRLPELGGAVGKALREFRKATSEVTNEITSATQSKPVPPASTSSESAAKGSSSEASPKTN